MRKNPDLHAVQVATLLVVVHAWQLSKLQLLTHTPLVAVNGAMQAVQFLGWPATHVVQGGLHLIHLLVVASRVYEAIQARHLGLPSVFCSQASQPLGHPLQKLLFNKYVLT